KLRCAEAAAGQDEIFERLERLLQLIDECFELRDVPLFDLRDLKLFLVLLEDAEIAAQMKQVVLDELKHRAQLGIDSAGDRNSDAAVELIDRAVGFDALAVLQHAL